MTYRDLIIYILENKLENEEVFQNGRIPGFMTIEETAAKNDVGVETIKMWIRLGYLKSIALGNVVYVPSLIEINSTRR